MGVVSFLLSKKIIFLKEERTNKGIKEGEHSKNFWPMW